MSIKRVINCHRLTGRIAWWNSGERVHAPAPEIDSMVGTLKTENNAPLGRSRVSFHPSLRR